LTGRRAEYSDVTLEWLNKNVLNDQRIKTNDCSLFTRKSGDYREDKIIKEEIYNDLIAPYFKVLFAIDDRQQVVDMWRSKGIVCLQCDVDNF